MFCFTSNENCHFSSTKNGDTPKRIVDFPLERDTFRNKIMEIVEDFDEQSNNNNGKPWNLSRILSVKPNFCIFLHFFIIFFIFSFSFFSFSFFLFFIFELFSCSFIFSHILSFSFFHFFIFHFFIFFSFFHFFNFSFLNFFHFRSFSFIFSHFLSCSFSLLGAQNLFFFSGLNFVTISLDSSHVEKQFGGPSRGVVQIPFVPSLRFFLLFFLPFFFLSFSFLKKIFSSFCVFFYVFHFPFSEEK